ncbi:hypothetical protein [Paenibacillus sp. MMO-177]|uniref:hypothetical protein n=1 Tax=Paenibacillus sp. MMO-177 TaxID=3081289 RepID=UPI003016955E
MDKQQFVDSLRALQTKLADATAEITSDDVETAKGIVRHQPSMNNRVLFAQVSARYQTQQDA